MITRLKSSDKKSMEAAIQACAIITDKMTTREATQQIDFLFDSGLVIAVCEIVCDPSNVSTSHVSQSLKLLRQLASVNRAIATALLKTSLPTALASILTFDLQSSPQREAQELIEAVKLVEALLPKTFKIPDPLQFGHYDDDSDSEYGDEDDDTDDAETKKEPEAAAAMTEEEFSQSQPLVELLYPLLLKLLTAAPNSSLRMVVIQALLRMSYSAKPIVLESLLTETDCHACSQIQQMLDSQDMKLSVRALQLTRAILTILPDFKIRFRREGLYHCLLKMSESKFKSPAATSAPASLLNTPVDSRSVLDPTSKPTKSDTRAKLSVRVKKLELARKRLRDIKAAEAVDDVDAEDTSPEERKAQVAAERTATTEETGAGETGKEIGNIKKPENKPADEGMGDDAKQEKKATTSNTTTNKHSLPLPSTSKGIIIFYHCMSLLV